MQEQLVLNFYIRPEPWTSVEDLMLLLDLFEILTESNIQFLLFLSS